MKYHIKKEILVSILFFITMSVFANDWEYIVTTDSYIRGRNIRDSEYINVNTKIISDNTATYGTINNERFPAFGFKYNSDSAYINAENIIPSNSNDLFGDNILTNKNNILFSYTIDILKSKRRETLLEFESYYRNNQSYFEDAYMRDIYWYENYDSYGAGLFVYNSVLFFGARYGDCQSLIINNIEKTEYGYKVRCRETSSPNIIILTVLNPEWEIIQKKDIIDLLIFIDGDYIDIFIDNINNKLGTFVIVSNEFVNQYNNLIKNNICDLSNIRWPQRENTIIEYLYDIEHNNNINMSDEIDSINNINEYIEIKTDLETEFNKFPIWLILVLGIIGLTGGILFILFRKKINNQ